MPRPRSPPRRSPPPRSRPSSRGAISFRPRPPATARPSPIAAPCCSARSSAGSRSSSPPSPGAAGGPCTSATGTLLPWVWRWRPWRAGGLWPEGGTVARGGRTEAGERPVASDWSRSTQDPPEIGGRRLVSEAGVEAGGASGGQSDELGAPVGGTAFELLHEHSPETGLSLALADHDLLHPGHRSVGEEGEVLEAEQVALHGSVLLDDQHAGTRVGDEGTVVPVEFGRPGDERGGEAAGQVEHRVGVGLLRGSDDRFVGHPDIVAERPWRRGRPPTGPGAAPVLPVARRCYPCCARVTRSTPSGCTRTGSPRRGTWRSCWGRLRRPASGRTRRTAAPRRCPA